DCGFVAVVRGGGGVGRRVVDDQRGTDESGRECEAFQGHALRSLSRSADKSQRKALIVITRSYGSVHRPRLNSSFQRQLAANMRVDSLRIAATHTRLW